MALPSFSAMVLSAGFGTRLRPITDEIPKPLMPIGGVPVLGLHLQELHERGACRLFVNAHYYDSEITNYINGLSFNIHVEHEEKIRGTAGGIAGVRRHVPPVCPLVVVNGDIVGKLPLDVLVQATQQGLTLAVTEAQLGQGTVGIGADDQVVRLRGQRFGHEVRSGDYMGVACLGDRCLSELPPTGCLVGDWALPALGKGERIATVTVSDDFEDIGTPRTYLEANLRWLSARGPRAGFAPSLKIPAGVEVRRSAIGQGVQILGEGLIEDCVLLPGATARAPLYRSIVTPKGVVVTVPDGTMPAIPRG
jgi:mannose-1-phosphate guanylyltransferase